MPCFQLNCNYENNHPANTGGATAAQSTMAHADDIRKLNKAEAETDGVREELTQARQELHDAMAAHSAALQAARTDKEALTQRAVEARVALAQQQSAAEQLRAQLDKLASEMAATAVEGGEVRCTGHCCSKGCTILDKASWEKF